MNRPGAHAERFRRMLGFTVVELLVVVSLIGLLVVLILPAINSARDQGARSLCAARHVKLAMGMARHNQFHGKLPAALSTVTMASGPAREGAWTVALLPYIEKNDLHNWMRANDSNWGESALVDQFLCPSAVTSNMRHISHVFANCGTGLEAFPSDGVFPPTDTQTVTLDDISRGDGLATTLMFAEVLLGSVPPAPGATNNGPEWKGEPAQPDFFARGPYFGLATDPPTTANVINTASDDIASRAPRSNHRGGATVVFCDGSARFLRDELPAYLYGHLVTSRTVWNGSGNYTPISSTRANNWMKAAPAPADQPYVLTTQDIE